MKKTLLLFSFLFLIVLTYAQDYYVKSVNGFSNQNPTIQIEVLENGDYMIAGSTRYFPSSQIKNKLFVRRYNQCGNEIWSRQITHDSVSISLNDLHLDSSGKILLAGRFDTIIGGNSFPKPFLIKLDLDGSFIYSKKVLASPIIAASPIATSIATNGDYLIYFIHNSTSTTFSDVRVSVMRLTESGTVVWTKIYDFTTKLPRNILATRDNGAIFKNSNILCKIDANGAVEWNNRYLGLRNIANPLETDSGYVVFDYFQNVKSATYLVRKDGSLENNWNSNDFNTGFYPSSEKGILRKNGNLLYCGTLSMTGEGAFAEINSKDGTIVRIKKFDNLGTLSGTHVSDVAETKEGNIIFTGEDNRFFVSAITLAKLNDTLSTTSCRTNSVPFPTQVSSLSNPIALNVTGINNTNYVAQNLSINLISEVTTSLPSLCEFTKDRGIYRLGNDTILCQKESIVLGDPSSNFESYLWSNGATTKTLLVTIPGDYTLQVVSACDTLLDTIRVSYYPEIGLELGADTTLCFGDSIVLAKNLSFNNYKWSDGSSNPTLTVKQAGIYWLEVQTNCGVVIDSITISFIDPLNPPILFPDTNICEGENITLDPGNLLNYYWSTGATSPTITVSDSNLYWVETRNTCDTLRDSVTIGFHPPINMVYTISETTVFTSDTIELINTSLNSANPIWNFGNGDSIFLDSTAYSYSIDGNYSGSLTVTTPNGCIQTDNFQIKVLLSEYFAPNIFSPNNDGINDVFQPVGKDIERFETSIYNRWGELIFKSNNTSWDGKNTSNKRAEEGTYNYLITIKLKNGKQETLKGNVTLIR